MIKKLWVDNFKSLNDFEITFTPFTVIIGNNSVGKSAVLHALDFLANCVWEDFNIIIERRGLQAQNVKSKLKSTTKIQFKSLVEIEVEGKKRLLEWEIQASVQVQKNSLLLHKERVVDAESQAVYLEWDSDETGFIKGKGNNEILLRGFTYKSSILNLIDGEKEKEKYPEICALKGFWSKTMSFDMLSPDKMRSSSRGKTDTIGKEGDKLPSFIKSMNESQKASFSRKLQEILNGKIKATSAKTEGKPGWTVLEAIEQYKDKEINVSSKDLSDGILRLLAFIAISEIGDNASVMLLDEIENGINVNYSEKLIEMLRDITEEKKQQLIVTTHSTVFMDFVHAEEIVYMFRDEQLGYTKAISLFEIPTFKRRLNNFYPGEVILNLSNEEILKEIMSRE